MNEVRSTRRVGGQGMPPEYLEKTEAQMNRAYSPAVVTEGGRTVWLAGQIATTDAEGRDIGGDFEAQTRRVFALMDQEIQAVAVIGDTRHNPRP